MNDVVNKITSKGIQTLYATPLFMAEITDEKVLDNAVDSILKLKENKEGLDRIENWSTKDNLQTLPEFKELADIILYEVGKTLDTLTIKRESHYIPCMWANVSPIGTAHSAHIHSNSFFSGVLYLQMPEGSNPTVFLDPRAGVDMLRPEYENPNPAILGAIWSTLPKRGTLLIFPSWLPHCVETAPFKPNHQRITLSFNIMLKTKINFHTTTVTFG